MAGTKTGGKKAAATNKMRYGVNFYVQIGRKGGQSSTEGGYASDVVGKDGLTGQQRAVIAGRRGGAASRRTKSGFRTKQGLEGLRKRYSPDERAEQEINDLIAERAEREPVWT